MNEQKEYIVTGVNLPENSIALDGTKYLVVGKTREFLQYYKVEDVVIDVKFNEDNQIIFMKKRDKKPFNPPSQTKISTNNVNLNNPFQDKERLQRRITVGQACNIVFDAYYRTRNVAQIPEMTDEEQRKEKDILKMCINFVRDVILEAQDEK